MAEVLRVIDPLEYHRAHVAKGVRPDGRSLLRPRRLTAHTVALKSTDGAALVRVGRTSVIAGVQVDAIAPSQAEPKNGRIVVNLEFPAICSAAAAATSGSSYGGGGQLDRDKAMLVELLQQTASGGLVDLEALCAIEGVAVWSCQCDLYVLEHDGNLADATMVAMMAALSTVMLPRVAAAEGSGALTVVEEHAVPVRLHRPLYPCTFGVLSDQLLFDPSAEEEALLSSSFTILLDGDGEIAAVHKSGGAPLPDGSLDASAAAAQKRLPSLKAAMQLGA